VNWQIPLLTMVIGGLALAESPEPPAATGYIEKFEVPERDEEGNLKWKLSGERAQINEDGLMTVINMRAEFYSSNRVDLVFTAPTCTLDRLNKRGHTDAPVRLERDNVVVTGTGANWQSDTSSFVVHSNVHVVISGQAADAVNLGLTE